MTEIIVRRFQPEKIILFGSQARGDADDGSDTELLKDARRWLRYAQEDFTLATHVLQQRDVAPRHAQLPRTAPVFA
jgi:predicted nucleotidyltransferase